MTTKAAPVKKVTKKAPAVKKAALVAEKPTEEKMESVKDISFSVIGVDGKSTGTMTLPGEYFGARVNKQLMAQAIRVYRANQRVGHASTKTRGEVEGSTRKIYKQKGTGKARHGAIRAPIFVGGGIVFGPKPRDYSLSLPPKMKHVALVSALTSQLKKKNIIVVSGFSDVAPKTKNMAATFIAVGAPKRTLFVVPKESEVIARAVRNLEYVDIMPVTDMHTYAVMTHGKIVFMKEAMTALKK